MINVSFLVAQNILEEYCDSIHNKGVPLDNCFGFVDGTVRPINHLGKKIIMVIKRYIPCLMD